MSQVVQHLRIRLYNLGAACLPAHAQQHCQGGSDEGGAALYPHVTAVINAKGGVQKTTVITSLAHRAAAEGRRVLVLDLDPQGNCAKALGFADDPLPGVQASDGGVALANSLVTGCPLVPIAVRPRMSVCAGGPGLSKALRQIATWAPRRKFEILNDLIEPIADDFDVILLDTPPTNLDIQALTLGVAAAVVIPCEIADDTAEDGVIGALTMVSAAKKRGNPTCTVAGVVLAATRLSHSTFSERRVARRTAQETTQRLRAFDSEVPILTSVLRQRADANLLRRHGRSTAELLDADDITLPRRQRRNVKRLKSTIESVIDELYPLIPTRAEGQSLACTHEPVAPDTATEATVDLSTGNDSPVKDATHKTSVDLTTNAETPASTDAKKEPTS